ncbi:hypothetical protein EWM62_01930 [Mucilaginibacter terrigena]|uniref:Uncharacterized protein n=1 Tax=Mucilaginibacter terrigena TaxID=2492395 RepID=A0A4Q5LRY2_9SPHI|nr:hypothetical protein [Mucilaginibacter terrigena]RYU92217.1 hypothetical protein EWM62_01930 [Mucilaginibacter terrigena]
MLKRILLLNILLLVVIANAFCQNPPQEFFKGLDMMEVDKPAAKAYFLEAANKDPAFFGTYHFLGVIATNMHQPDSAIFYYKKAIELNKGNAKLAAMTYLRLINEYVYSKDFKNAFDTGWNAYKLYPEDRMIATALKDACLWSVYIKYDNLDPNYLSADIKDEYVVTSIDQEYLILRKLRVNDNTLSVSAQSLANKKGASYDILKCFVQGTKDQKEIMFKINWDMAKYFGGKPADTQKIDASKPIYERIGAIMLKDDKADLKTEIEKLMN